MIATGVLPCRTFAPSSSALVLALFSEPGGVASRAVWDKAICEARHAAVNRMAGTQDLERAGEFIGFPLSMRA